MVNLKVNLKGLVEQKKKKPGHVGEKKANKLLLSVFNIPVNDLPFPVFSVSIVCSEGPKSSQSYFTDREILRDCS